MGLVLPGNARQVGKARHGSGFGDAVTAGKELSGPLQPQIHQVGLRRLAVGLLELGGKVPPVDVQGVRHGLDAAASHKVGIYVGFGVFGVAAGPFYQIAICSY